jgi:hypothetical protein
MLVACIETWLTATGLCKRHLYFATGVFEKPYACKSNLRAHHVHQTGVKQSDPEAG